MTVNPGALDQLATNVLLGQSTAAEQAEFDRLFETDVQFRTLVQELEAWLSPLDEVIPEQAPPAGLLDDILAEIEALDSASGDKGDITPELVATADLYAATPKASGGLAFWRSTAFASIVIAILAVGTHFIPRQVTPVAPPAQEVLVVLSQGGTGEAVVLKFNPETQEFRAQLTNVDVPDQGVWELWLIREGAAGPRSMGLLNTAGKKGALELFTHLEGLSATDTLAISLEPEGGSPADGPTGPVLFAGKVGDI